jgi:hypothetical protein
MEYRLALRVLEVVFDTLIQSLFQRTDLPMKSSWYIASAFGDICASSSCMCQHREVRSQVLGYRIWFSFCLFGASFLLAFLPDINYVFMPLLYHIVALILLLMTYKFRTWSRVRTKKLHTISYQHLYIKHESLVTCSAGINTTSGTCDSVVP